MDGLAWRERPSRVAPMTDDDRIEINSKKHDGQARNPGYPNSCRADRA